MLENSQIFDYKEDWKAKENLRFAHNKALKAIEQRNALQRIDYKNQLDSDAGDLIPAELTVGRSLTPTYPELPKTLTATTGTSILDARSSSFPATYAYLMSTKDVNVNKEMLRSIKASNPKATDGQIIDMYNAKRVDTNYSKVHYYPFKTTGSQQEESNRLLPGLMNGSYRVYEMDGGGQVTEIEKLDDKIDLAKKLKDPKNPLKTRVPAIGKSLGFTGQAPSGATVFPDPDKEGKVYFVASPQTNMARANQDIVSKAFGYMKDGRQQGDYFEINDKNTGKKVGLVGVTHYENGEPIRIFYGARNNGKEVNFDDPLTINGRIAEPYDLERLLFDDETVKKLFPSKTKPNYEAEFLTQ